MESRTVGSTALDTIRPNIMRVRWSGELTAKEVIAVGDFAVALRCELSDDVPIYTLVEIGERVTIKKGARKGIMALGREKPWAGIAVVGARFEVKVLLELTLNAVRLLMGKSAPTKFVENEEQALAWFDEQAISTEPAAGAASPDE